MKAMVYHRYGGPEVVTAAELATPTPKDNEVLIRIRATTVSSGDYRARSLNLPGGFSFLGRPVFGLFGPRQPILGTELAGEIVAVGAAVTRFKIGDEVFAFPGAKMGSHAQFRTMPEDGRIALKPANLSFEEAAALSFGGTTALDFLRTKGELKAGEKVLVIGASGSVGSAAVQIAKALGAEVTGVTSTPNLKLVRSLGADHVIDYKTEDFTQNGQTYDVIFNANAEVSFDEVNASLNPGGRLLLVMGTLGQMIGLEKGSKATGKRVIPGVASETAGDLNTLATLAAEGKFRPLIDRSYPLTDAAEAHAYVQTGRKRGNVVLIVGHANDA